jgi:hypothetical protein
MIVRRTHQERRLERSFWIHTGHNTAGNVRSFVANPVTEFKILTFGPMGKIAKLTTNWKSEKWKRNSSNGEKIDDAGRGGVPVTV